MKKDNSISRILRRSDAQLFKLIVREVRDKLKWMEQNFSGGQRKRRRRKKRAAKKGTKNVERIKG